MPTVMSPHDEQFYIEAINPADIGITTLHAWLDDLKKWKETKEVTNISFPSIQEMEMVFDDISENGQSIPLEVVIEIISLEEEFWNWKISLRQEDEELAQFGKDIVESYKRLVEAFAEGKKYDDLSRSVGLKTSNILKES